MIDKERLDELIAESGVGGRTARKLRAANGETPRKRPRGHGAPAPQKLDLGEI